MTRRPKPKRPEGTATTAENEVMKNGGKKIATARNNDGIPVLVTAAHPRPHPPNDVEMMGSRLLKQTSTSKEVVGRILFFCLQGSLLKQLVAVPSGLFKVLRSYGSRIGRLYFLTSIPNPTTLTLLPFSKRGEGDPKTPLPNPLLVSSRRGDHRTVLLDDEKNGRSPAPQTLWVPMNAPRACARCRRGQNKTVIFFAPSLASARELRPSQVLPTKVELSL
jgi:hypothetical protein